jgi:hypothetical protein
MVGICQNLANGWKLDGEQGPSLLKIVFKRYSQHASTCPKIVSIVGGLMADFALRQPDFPAALNQ